MKSYKHAAKTLRSLCYNSKPHEINSSLGLAHIKHRIDLSVNAQVNDAVNLLIEDPLLTSMLC